MTLSSPTRLLSSRPKGRAVCGPQWRDLLLPSSSALLGLPFVAAAFRDGRLSPVAQTLVSVLLGSLFSVAAAFRGGRRSPSLVAPMIIQRPTSAGGAQEVNPARKGWVPVPTIFPSAVGAAPLSRSRGPSFRAERPDLFFRAGLWRVGSRSRGIPLCLSSVSSAVNSPFFSSFAPSASAFTPTRSGRYFSLSFNFHLSTPEPHLP